MLKKAFLDFRVGQCGGCGLEIRFWAQDGARLTCVNCGKEHEVECDEMLNLTMGKRTHLVMIVVSVLVEKERNWNHNTGAN